MIPIMRPKLPAFGEVAEDIRKCFDSGMLIMGENVKRFETEVARYLGVKHAVATSSCSVGLIIAMSTLEKGSEVIMPSFTFSATAQAAVWNGLKPVLVDCDEYCNIDPRKTEAAITPRTSAILGVHMFGSPCDVDALEDLARRRGIRLFFDAAHAFGSESRGRKIGGFGDAEIFSLGVTKAFATGEGGIISTDDDAFAGRMRLAANNGRGAGSIDPTALGLSGRFQEFNAIIGLHSLRTIGAQLKRRKELYEEYRRLLSGVPGLRFCPIPDGVVTTFKDLALFVDKERFGMSRDRLAEFLAARNIQVKFYFDPPIHRIRFFGNEYAGADLANTERLSRTTISLPFYTGMTLEDIAIVCKTVCEARS